MCFLRLAAACMQNTTAEFSELDLLEGTRATAFKKETENCGVGATAVLHAAETECDSSPACAADSSIRPAVPLSPDLMPVTTGMYPPVPAHQPLPAPEYSTNAQGHFQPC